MSIKDLPAAARPREKLLAHGAASLADAELLALAAAHRRARAWGCCRLAEAVLSALWRLCSGLLHAGDVRHAARCQGPGPGQARRIGGRGGDGAALSGHSSLAAAAGVRLTGRSVKQYVQLHLARVGLARFSSVLFLDSTTPAAFGHGGDVPRLAGRRLQRVPAGRWFKRALAIERNAGAVILAHNHPSGVAEPSRADEFLTQSLKTALALVDVKVLDHLVVGAGHGRCPSPSGACCETCPSTDWPRRPWPPGLPGGPG